MVHLSHVESASTQTPYRTGGSIREVSILATDALNEVPPPGHDLDWAGRTYQVTALEGRYIHLRAVACD